MTSQSVTGVAAIRICKGVEICCCCLVCHAHCRTEDSDHSYYFSFRTANQNLTLSFALLLLSFVFASLPFINLVSWHTTFEFSTAGRKILCECIMPVSSAFIIILSTHSNHSVFVSRLYSFAYRPHLPRRSSPIF